MAKIAIIGSGVVGNATGTGFMSKGHNVVFCDVNKERLKFLEAQGKCVCPANRIDGEFGIEAAFFSVSTPTVDGKIFLDNLFSAVRDFGAGYLKFASNYMLVTIRSTVPPGTTRKTIIPMFEKASGKKAGQDFGVCMNPEYLRERADQSVSDFMHPWIVVIGELDKKSGDILQDIYGECQCPVKRVALDVAEAEKYGHNCLNASMISFFNEWRMILQALEIDPDEVFPLMALSAEARWNPQYGIRDWGPYGLTCLPKDTVAFRQIVMERLGYVPQILDATIKVNELVEARQTMLASLRQGNGETVAPAAH